MFYCTVIRWVLEYGSQISCGGLTQLQKKSIEIVQKRTLRIINAGQVEHDALLTHATCCLWKNTVIICVRP